MEIAGAVTNSATSDRHNRAKRSPVTRIEGCRSGPTAFGDANEEMNRPTAGAELVSELEAATNRLHVRAAQLIAIHRTSMACDTALDTAAEWHPAVP
jgi:hypothetical protein